MFVLTNNVSAAMRVIATLLATAIVMWSIGYYATAEAANLTDLSDVLSDSAPSASPTHTFSFVNPTQIEIGETIEITFPAGFTGIASILDTDVTIDDDGSDINANVAAAGAGQVVTMTLSTAAIAADSVIDIVIGVTNFISNPASPAGGNESFEIGIAGTMTDLGYTRVVILDTTEVTASVLTTFDFTVFDNGTGEDVNGDTTTITTSSTTIPFGTLTAYTPVIGSQDLTVQTNAINGFVVTVETDQSLLSSTGADIDNFKDDVIAVPAAWESPITGLDIDDEKTWGHWGITSEDSDLNSNEFGNQLWAGVTSTPRQVFSHDGPADSTTPDKGSTTVGFQVEISALQEAGDDYSTTLTYIATPTF